MRRGEILGLRWKDIDLKKGTISIRQILVTTAEGLRFQEPKTEKSRRSVAISPAVIEALKKHRQRQLEEALILGKPEAAKGLVFTSQAGTPINPRNLARHFESVIKKEGLPPIPFHALRHTHATLMLQGGVHPKVVSERLGHSGIGTTMDIYSHVMPDMQKEAAEKFEQELLVKTLGEKKERT
ncbi:site-specific integrase [Calderihabitans maritimus]|uniref:Integrase n=1 Tax=Calderihabitans maritimus TaxID=1246530 RepID=A0A1Z5HQU4_9FIRM|nr:site-specific integrase [Calderihabitans maritimus]GAW91903.1 integrase [Calderihabitans maritimus]